MVNSLNSWRFYAMGMVKNRINGSKPSMGSTFIRRISKGVWVAQVTSRGGLFGYPRLFPQWKT